MIAEGDLVLFRFPQADLNQGKLRPALLIREIPGLYDTWLVCMVSTQLHHQIEGLEEIVRESDEAFGSTGLKRDSLIRSSRLAVVDRDVFEGKIGSLSKSRFTAVRGKLSRWIARE